MKISVYTIAKNEEQFVKRWYGSCKDADYIFILDYDLAAISYYNLGMYKKSLEYGEMALKFNPNDERLIVNLEWYNKK